MADTRAALDQFGADLHDADKRLDKERLRLALGWRQLEVATKEAQGQTESVAAESRKEATEARASRNGTLTEADAAAKRYSEAEASLKALRDER